MNQKKPISPDKPASLHPLSERARHLGLWGLVEHLDDLEHPTWASDLLDWEESARTQRSLQRRIQGSHIGRFKPMADFDWDWPEQIDRNQVEDLFTFRFLEEHANVILVGPNGTGKSMIAQNLAHQALLRGHTVAFTTASKLLGELVAQDSSTSLERRLRRLYRPRLLVIDEVGYLSYDNRHADLLFEVITRRYHDRPTLITTNKAFGEWNEVFPNAACVVALIDRLIHHSEIVEIQGESYRFKEAKERAAQKAKLRTATKRAASEAKTESRRRGA
jgi:DNA replication protein DnaC